MPKVVTANRLDDGVVVFLDSNDRWSVNLTDARAFDSATADADIETETRPLVNTEKVVSVYVMAVDRVDGLLTPISVRERIRAAHRPSI